MAICLRMEAEQYGSTGSDVLAAIAKSGGRPSCQAHIAGNAKLPVDKPSVGDYGL